nr:response regulator transcription factor [Streptomyces sp. SID5470]
MSHASPRRSTRPDSSITTRTRAVIAGSAELAAALSPREIDILRLEARGRTNREIAAQLYLSEGTVKNHVSRILSRLSLRDRTQAALRARDLGLL